MNTKALTQVVTTPYTDKFVRSVIGLLRPLVRLVLGRMTGTVLLDLLRRVLVQEAFNQLSEKNQGKVTLSEIALLTGIDSRMVKQLMRNPPSCTEADLSGEAKVLYFWKNDVNYHDSKTGRPADLLLFGPGNTFQSLVSRAAGRNVTVQTVLERLSSNGNVVIVGEHWVRMISHCYQVIDRASGHCPGDDCVAMQNLGLTLMHNMYTREQMAVSQGDGPGGSASPIWVQKQCILSGLSQEQAANLRHAIERLLAEQISTTERVMSQLTNAQTALTVAPEELNVGVGYFYWEKQ